MIHDLNDAIDILRRIDTENDFLASITDDNFTGADTMASVVRETAHKIHYDLRELIDILQDVRIDAKQISAALHQLDQIADRGGRGS